MSQELRSYSPKMIQNHSPKMLPYPNCEGRPQARYNPIYTAQHDDCLWHYGACTVEGDGLPTARGQLGSDACCGSVFNLDFI